MISIKNLYNTFSNKFKEKKVLPDLSKKKITIFLVDDNELYLKGLEAQFLQNPDLLIKTFLTGESCLQSITTKPDIVILDYYLAPIKRKTIEGLEMLLMIKNKSPETQVIMLSAGVSAEIAVNCVKHGAFDYIAKDDETFIKLKKAIKKVFGAFSKEKEIIVWDW